MSEGRLPWLRPDEMSPEQREVYEHVVGGRRGRGGQEFPLTDDQGRPHGPFNAMVVAPAVGDALQALGATLRYGTSLSDRVREIVTLLVAAFHHSAFEWYAHERLAARAGLTGEEIRSLHDLTPPESLTDDERSVFQAALALLRDRDLDDHTYENVRGVLGPEALVELVSLVGYYELLALHLRVWRVGLPAGVAHPFTGG